MKPPLEWDQDAADALVGLTVLIGLTFVNARNEETGLEQLHGVIEAVDRDGVHVRLGGTRDGELYRLPPALRSFHPADPGVYRLRGSGEEITDPDLLTTWTIEAPSRQ